MRPAVILAVLMLIIAGIYATWTQTRNRTPGPVPGTTISEADRLANFRRLKEPTPIPSLTVTDMSGAQVDVRDLAGKVLLINFWATWCGPCREEMPALDRLQAKLGGPSFQVVAISLDQGGAERVEKFLKDEKIKNLKPYLDPQSKSLAAFQLLGLPTSLLVGADGREIGRLLGPAKWDSNAAIALIRTAQATPPGGS